MVVGYLQPASEVEAEGGGGGGEAGGTDGAAVGGTAALNIDCCG